VPRIHSIEDVIPYEVPDFERPGEMKLETRLGTSCLEFKKNNITGDYVAEILDTEYNRHFVANQKGNGVVATSDEFQQRFIDVLIGKKFDVEVSEAESIRRDIRRLQGKLVDAEAKEPKLVVAPVAAVVQDKPAPVQPAVETVAVPTEARARKRGRPAVRRSAVASEPAAKDGTDGVNQPDTIVG